MEYAKTIAMATDLLADGRAEDVVRMVEPLLEPIDRPATAATGQVLLHTLMARVELVHRMNVDAAFDHLSAFDDSTAQASLDDAARAEVTLWLGWAHALKNRHAHEDAQALSLLDEAQRLFQALPSPSGRCWSLLGRARAYFAIDEYHLMRRVLDEAAALHAKTHDAQAGRWLHDLRIPALRFQGAYDDAQTHVDALFDLADRWNEHSIRGHALAHRAALRYDLGRDPSAILDAATSAETLLQRFDGGSEYPLLAAYHAHVGALLRQGQWDQAASVLEDAEAAVSGYAVGQAHLQTVRARLALRQGDLDAAETFMEDLFENVHHLPHGLQRSHVALLRGELLAERDRFEDAQTWMQRASRNARETGHRGNQLRALFTLAQTAVDQGNLEAAGDWLAQTEDYDDYFSVLPYARMRFSVLGDEARAAGRMDEALSAYAQALSAASLIGDAPRTAELRETLSSLQPAGSDASGKAFSSAAAPELEQTLGAALSRASLSVDLVADAWIRGVKRLLPGRWMGVFQNTEDGRWACIHEHGMAPDDLTLPPPSEAEVDTGPVFWIRLRGHSSRRFFFGVTVDDLEASTWTSTLQRLRPWVPVAQLALDRALLRRYRVNERPSPPPLDASVPVDGFVSESPTMASLARQIRRIHMSHSPVLITGERGTGKTLVGRAVHATSERSDGPFRRVRCANLQEDPMEARLFGQRMADGSLDPGAFHDADGGTLLLEDVETLPLPLQSSLVRALDSHEVVPQGATEAQPVNVRVLASSSTPLKSEVTRGQLREDLYYRLNVISLEVPPLRERRDDLPLLVRHFLNTLGPDDLPRASITNRALEVLLRYDWPGNVRQLHNEIERALLLVSSEPAPTIDVELLSNSLVEAVSTAPDASPASDRPSAPDAVYRSDHTLSDVLADTERQVIQHVLRSCNGQVTASAEVLGLTRQGLYKKMKRLDIDASNFQIDEEPAMST